ncbi:hypothetical protein PM082_009240 [Marasmius tenuissimus]|nr:hypothetical protein PM082_009240 [Marasmius tenuissimus]
MVVAFIVLVDGYKFTRYLLVLPAHSPSQSRTSVVCMSSIGDLPFLSFAANSKSFDAGDYPHLHLMERGIDRRTLLDVAPDREELIMSNRSIEEYRDALKLRGTPDQLQWLYMTTHRQDVQKLRNTPDRTSAFITKDENGAGSLQIVRRASLSAFNPLTNIENVGGASTRTHNISWGVANLSTRDVLISPRPLGPTHICVLVEDNNHGGTIDIGGGGSGTTTKQRAKLRPQRLLHTQTIDQPINDLLFTLNAPNLLPADADSGVSTLSSLPRRLHKELPRAGIRVPHLDTFPALIVYLHMKNQAELFRRIVPEFIRDIMHPLFAPRAIKGGSLDVQATLALGLTSLDERESIRSSTGLGATGAALSRWIILPFRRTGNSVVSDSGTPARLSDSSKTPVAPAQVDILAKEIVRAAVALGEDEVLIKTASLLNALRDNLLFVGYLEHALWEELELSRQVLLRAIGVGAAFTN